MLLGGLIVALRSHSSESRFPQGNTSAQTTSGGTGSPRTAASDAALQVFVGADVSASVDKALRRRAFDGLRFALTRAVPPGTPVHFVYYDTGARTDPKVVAFYEPRDIDSIGNAIYSYAPRPEKGTQQALALSRLAKEADDLPKGTPVAFVLLTDSEDQGLSATKEQAALLAKRPGFRALMVIGARRESSTRQPMRDRLQAALEPLGQKRLLCGDVTEHDVGLFKQLVNP